MFKKSISFLVLAILIGVSIITSAQAGTQTCKVPNTPFGYRLVGVYNVGDICWGLSGTCVFISGATMLDILPGDEIGGPACFAIDAICWGADTAARYFGYECYIYVFKAEWWNFWWRIFGMEILIIPSCCA